MELELTEKIDIAANFDVQYHRLMLLSSGTVVALYSDDNQECYFLDWHTASGVVTTRIEEFTYDVFDPPSLFQFPDYLGIYATSGNMLYLFTEKQKAEPIRISISNTLADIQYPGFKKQLTGYVYAGSTDDHTVPFLFKDSGLLPVYFAELKIEVAERSARWLSLSHWNSKHELNAESIVLQKPAQKPFTLLHALRKNEQTYIFSIGDRDGGYLKYGMDYSDLCLLGTDGKVREKLFSLGALNKGAKKGGKECLFTSSGTYAILSPVFNTDDWKGRQKMLDIDHRQLIDVALPEDLSDYKIIDHNQGCFLAIDGLKNQIITGITGLAICKAKTV